MKSVVYLFQDVILFIGRLPPNAVHSIPVETLSTNLDGDFRVMDDTGQYTQMKTCYWRAGVSRITEYEPSDRLAFMLFPNYLEMAPVLQKKMQFNCDKNTVAYGIEQEEVWVRFLSDIYHTRPSIDAVKLNINKILGDDFNVSLFNMSAVLDERIKQAIHLLKQEVTYGQHTELHKALGISASHLRRLFKAKLGNSMSQYRMHLKILSAALLKSDGNDLTQSAYGAGFYDLPHLNKLHKKGYGVPIASTISQSDIIVEHDIKPIVAYRD